jgi:hypothetical protein
MNLLSNLLLLFSILPTITSQLTGTYLPLAYTISKTPECLYERISSSSEHITGSVFVFDGSELKALVAIEGPVAPIDIDLETDKEYSGHELQMAIDRYNKEGTKAFGDDIDLIRFAQLVDFESEEEMYDDAPEGGLSEEQVREMEMEQEERERRLEMEKRKEMVAKRDARREHQLQEQVEREFEYDDDFVKLQMEKGKKRGVERKRKEDRGRRLTEVQLMAGEPYQKTFLVKSPGW